VSVDGTAGRMAPGCKGANCRGRSVQDACFHLARAAPRSLKTLRGWAELRVSSVLDDFSVRPGPGLAERYKVRRRGAIAK